MPNHQHQELDKRWEGLELHNYEQHDSLTEPRTMRMLEWVAWICVGTGNRGDGVAHHIRSIITCVQFRNHSSKAWQRPAHLVYVFNTATTGSLQPKCSLSRSVRGVWPTTNIWVAISKEKYLESLWINIVTYKVQVEWVGGRFCRLSNQNN